MVMVMYPTNGFVHDDRPAYDLPIKCSDTNNDVYSSLNVDIQKNEPPVYSSPTGYLPGNNCNPQIQNNPFFSRSSERLVFSSAVFRENPRYCYSLGVVVVHRHCPSSLSRKKCDVL